MDKYTTSLSSLTNGRGLFSIKLASYEKIPSAVQDELLKTYTAEEEEEEE